MTLPEADANMRGIKGVIACIIDSDEGKARLVFDDVLKSANEEPRE